MLVEGTHFHKKASFNLALSRHYDVVAATTGKQAQRLADMVTPDIIVLNGASLRTSGERICSALRQQCDGVPLIYILKEKMSQPNSSQDNADVILRMPFTSRKLINRIQRFLEADDGEVLEVGPFHLNLKNHILTTTRGNTRDEERLTPKMAALLELFLRNPNEVLKRDYLMQEVWQTDYMGDTRTLDVHIRWIREAVEKNPSKPNYIITVRGVGYKMSLNPSSKKKPK